MDNLQQIKHLVARAGFGLRFEDIPADENLSVKKMVNNLFKASSANDTIAVITENTDYAMLVKGDIATKKMFLHACMVPIQDNQGNCQILILTYSLKSGQHRGDYLLCN